MQTSIIDRVLTALNSAVLGKPRQTRLALACMLSGGHLLIEDHPGLGKTTLAHAMARVLGLQFRRIQFTNDLLPSDILGINVFLASTGAFEFKPGPVFANVVLADELNRASARTQSAMLEAMEERQVTLDGERRGLPCPFFVIATQNPEGSLGTQRLPESQLDRFAMRISLGYPDVAAERKLLETQGQRSEITALPSVLTHAQVNDLVTSIATIHVAGTVLDYIVNLVNATRHHAAIALGLSPRASLALAQTARALAFMGARDYVKPDDIQEVFVAVAGHRLVPRLAGQRGEALATEILAAVPVPGR